MQFEGREFFDCTLTSSGGGITIAREVFDGLFRRLGPRSGWPVLKAWARLVGRVGVLIVHFEVPREPLPATQKRLQEECNGS